MEKSEFSNGRFFLILMFSPSGLQQYQARKVKRYSIFLRFNCCGPSNMYYQQWRF